MLIKFAATSLRPLGAAALALVVTAGPAPLAAQEIQAVDPNQSINSDLAPPPGASGYQDPGQPVDQVPPPSAPPPAAFSSSGGQMVRTTTSVTLMSPPPPTP